MRAVSPWAVWREEEVISARLRFEAARTVGRDPVRDFSPSRPQPVRYADFELAPQMAVLSVRDDSVPQWIAAGFQLPRQEYGRAVEVIAGVALWATLGRLKRISPPVYSFCQAIKVKLGRMISAG